MPSWSFHSALLASTLTFLGLAALAAVAKSATRSKKSRFARFARKADTLVHVVLVIAYAVYPSLAAKVFAAFNCGKVAYADGDELFLLADYSIKCDDPAHKLAEAYASACVVFICLGTPVLYLALLWRSLEAVQSGARSAAHLHFLVQDYRHGCWYVI